MRSSTNLSAVLLANLLQGANLIVLNFFNQPNSLDQIGETGAPYCF